MIALRDQAYYVPGLPKDLRIIYPQGIWTSEGYKGILIDHFNDGNYDYAELNLKGKKPGWQKDLCQVWPKEQTSNSWSYSP